MILDKQNLFSDDQAITASAASINVIDLGSAEGIGQGQPIPVLIQVTETFNNLTDLTIALQTDSDEDFGSATTLLSEKIVLAALVAGKKSAIQVLPDQCERYIRLYYTVNGSAPDEGKITAGVVSDVQANVA